MKKGTKIGIGIAALFAGAMVLTGCTNSFCSLEDKAHILYAIDDGVCDYYATEAEANAAKAADEERYANATEKQKPNIEIGVVDKVKGFDNVWYYAKLQRNTTFYKVYTAAAKAGYRTPSLNYYIAMDTVVLENALAAENKTVLDPADIRSDDFQEGILIRQGYLKYFDSDATHTKKKQKKLWTNWAVYNDQVRTGDYGVHIDECPQNDFITYYKNQMNSKISANRSCLATKQGFYGNYGDGRPAEITKKDWGYAWSNVGFLSGLLVYPIGWLIDTFTIGLMNGVGSGWAQLLAILFVTLIVRSIMFVATFKQTSSSSKMQELQPEIAKIQAKYPNSNTNNYEKQRLAQETQALYKKHKINPLTSILVMIIQFPVFICVWGALQGSAMLSSGAVLGLDLSKSISSVLTTWSNWANPSSGVWTALALFLLMTASQVVSMLLPQWISAAEKKKIAKLGRNPSQKESDNKMKWFTYIMLGMIIFMGFSLVSALGVYWLVGALFSIAQTVIMHAVMKRKKQKKNKNR